MDHDQTSTDASRRGSSGTLLSPEVDIAGESDKFYMLKKDSQRRKTLAKVLDQDNFVICDLWMKKIESKSKGETIITTQHLFKMLTAFKEDLVNTSSHAIVKTVKDLKVELDFEGAAINQLQLAVCLYQVRLTRYMLYQQ